MPRFRKALKLIRALIPKRLSPGIAPCVVFARPALGRTQFSPLSFVHGQYQIAQVTQLGAPL